MTWQKKIESVIDKPRLGQRFSIDLSDIPRDFHAEFDFTDTWILELGICNRTTLAETGSFSSPVASSASSANQPAEPENPPFRVPLIPPTNSRRTQSMGSEKSVHSVIWSPIPPIIKPDQPSPTDKPQLSPPMRTRARTNSNSSSRGPA